MKSKFTTVVLSALIAQRKPTMIQQHLRKDHRDKSRATDARIVDHGCIPVWQDFGSLNVGELARQWAGRIKIHNPNREPDDPQTLSALQVGQALSAYTKLTQQHKMGTCRTALLRCITQVKNAPGMENFKSVEHYLSSTPVDLSGTAETNLDAPRVSRRNPDYSQTDVLQLRDNVAFGTNDYTDEAAELLSKSQMIRKDEQTLDLYVRMFETYNMVASWDQHHGTSAMENRGRIMVTGEFNLNQGSKPCKMLTGWFKNSMETDPNDPVVKYWLRKGHGFDITDFNDIRDSIAAGHNPVDSHGVNYLWGYLKYKEIVETGRSTAANGVDMIASVVLLITLLFGNLGVAKKLNLFAGGLPYLMKESPDIWKPIVMSVFRKWKQGWGGIKITEDQYRMLRQLVKDAGTPKSFGAGVNTLAYAIMGLNIRRDSMQEPDRDQLASIESRCDISPFFADEVEGMDFKKLLKFHRDKAEDLEGCINKHIPTLDTMNTLTRNAAAHRVKVGGASGAYRDNAVCPLPSYYTPDGFHVDMVPWQRNPFVTNRIHASVDGDQADVDVSHMQHNLEPNMLTTLIHPLEAYIERCMNRWWLGELKRDMAGVFDNMPVHFPHIPKLLKGAPKVLKQAVHDFRELNVLDDFCETVGVPCPKPQFEMSDLPDNACFYDA